MSMLFTEEINDTNTFATDVATDVTATDTNTLEYEHGEPDAEYDYNEQKPEEDAVRMVETSDLNDVTYAYLKTMVEPYSTAISQVIEVDQLTHWVPHIFQGELLEMVLKTLEQETDAEKAKISIINVLESLVLSTIQNIPLITPWTIAGSRDEITTKLFGEASSIIPVHVTIGPNTYTHNLSEEFAFGLLSVLHDRPQFVISINGVMLSLENLEINYKPEYKQEFQYEATFPLGPARFNSPDVIQGVMTAAKWLNADPHTFAHTLKGLIDGQMVPLHF
jgi:hypothetical protein